MADIATLGLAIDSRQAVSAKTALDGLRASAGGAERATTALEGAAAKASTRLAQSGKESEIAGRRHGAAAGSLSQLSFQINDIAGGLAMGQSPFQILAQQGGQVFQVWQMNNDVFRQAGRLILGFLTPMRLLGIAAGALAIGGYAINSAWQESAQKLDDAARSAGTTLQVMRALRSEAAVKGIDADEFFKGFEQFGKSVYQARAGLGGLAEVFRANRERAGDFNTTLERAAELIKNARDDTQRLELLRQMGLPANMQWVRLMSQGADGIRKAREEAEKMPSRENALVEKAREFDEALSRGWESFSTGANSAFVGVKAGLVDLGSSFTSFFLRINPGLRDAIRASALAAGKQMSGDDVNSFYNAIGGASGSPTKITVNARKSVDKDTLVANNQRYAQTIGLLGQLATTNEIVRAKEAELNNAWLTSNVSLGNRKQALLDLVRLQVEQSRASQAANFGIFNPAQQAEIQRLQISALYNDGTIKSAQDYASAVAVIGKNIRDASEQAAIARSPFEQMTRYALDAANTTKQLDEFGVNALGGLETGIASVVTRTKSLKDAFKDMTNSIISDLVRMTVRSTITGPLSGALSGLFSSLGGGGSSWVGGIGHNARGTDNWRGGPTWVGEDGPEIIDAPRGSRITPNHALRGGSGAQVVNNFIVENHAKANVQERQERNSSGGIDHRVIIMSTVKQGMAGGELDASQRGRFGNRPPKVL